ncbi:MAG: APC family permease [Actinomycetales bacterium]|nr:APC family permease [Actinomycetales bacterium]
MPDILDAARRALLGRPERSERLHAALLPKRVALPVFASDALSSVAYAPDEIFLTLALAGVTAVTISPWVGLAVVVVLLTVVASYRQNVRAYPSGGGDYEVVTTNLGPRAGVAAGAALLVDYVLTVAVSASAGAHYFGASIPWLHGRETWFAVGIIVVITLVNLRGIRESGRGFALATYAFMLGAGLVAVVGAVRHLTGTLGQAESAAFEIVPQAGLDQGLVGLAGGLLVLRAFASGCAALTGVEAISNGVPNFREPKARNAATTLGLLGAIGASLLASIILLAGATGVRYVEDPATQLRLDGAPPPADYRQVPVLGQLARTVFDGAPWLAVAVTVVTGLILVLAANTAFNGFPVLGSVLARDGYLPRQLHTRGDRLVFSNGILTLGAAAVGLVLAFDASVTRLIQLYIVGVFVSFTLSQLGMVRHWTRELRTEPVARERARMARARVVNAIGLGMTGTVLVVVLVTKFAHGAWITLLAMLAVGGVMVWVQRYYARVNRLLAIDDDPAESRALPSRVHAIVLVSRLHKPTLRAVAYARASRPSVLEAVTVGLDDDEVRELLERWEALDLPVPLKVLDSPYRELARPFVGYVRSIRRAGPRDVVVVYVPEYAVRRWWERLLHNQSTLRIKMQLAFVPGVIVAAVPYQRD